MYNFTTIPGEGYGDNGQGTELELLLTRALSRQVEVPRPHPQPLQPELLDELRRLRRPQPGPRSRRRAAGDCGEFDPRSNQYIKLRGLAVCSRPGYTGSTRPPSAPMTSASSTRSSSAASATSTATTRTASSSRARAVDRQAHLGRRSASRCRGCGPARTSTPACSTRRTRAYGLQIEAGAEPRVRRRRHRPATSTTSRSTRRDHNLDDGRDLRPRFRNGVVGVKARLRPSPWLDFRARGTTPFERRIRPSFGAPSELLGHSGFSPVPGRRARGQEPAR